MFGEPTGSAPMAALKRILIGRPISSADEHHQRLVEEDRPAGVRVGRDLVDRVRDRRDPGRLAAPGRDRGGRLRSAGADRDRRVRAAGDRGDLVPPDDHGVPVGWRRLHREPREPGRRAVARRRVGPARRLHPDGGGQRRRWCARDPYGNRFRQQVDRARVPVVRVRHHGDEPARREGIGRGVRRADVLLHRDVRSSSSRPGSTGSSSSTSDRFPTRCSATTRSRSARAPRRSAC